MADFKTLLSSSTHQSCFLVKPAPSAATTSEKIASQERQAEQALVNFSCSAKLHRLPYQAAAEAQTRAWLSDLCQGRLPAARVQRLLDSRFETLGCSLYPFTRSQARTLALNKLVIWTFILDDIIDDPRLLGQDPEAARRLCHRSFKAMFSSLADIEVPGITSHEDCFDDDRDQQGVATGALHAHPSDMDARQEAKAQQDLAVAVGVQWVDDMRNLGMSLRHLERARETVAHYMLGIVACARLRQENRVPSLQEYIRLRHMEGAGWLNLICCEFSLGIELDDDTWEHPLIRKLDATTSNHLLWMNDLLAFDREYENEDYITLLAVLHYNNHTARSDAAASKPRAADFGDAIHEARALITAVHQERMALGAEIAAWRPDLQAYFDALDHTITGLTFWTLWSQRYQGEAH